MRWLRIREALDAAWRPGPQENPVWEWARRRRGPWTVAFSGGADSLALLLRVSARASVLGRRVVALHVNHGLRGRASADDARFCRAVCRSLGVECEVKKVGRPSAAQSEAALRDIRLGFFGDALTRLGGRVLFLGHQRDDVAETLLMRLARGSGAGGLSAPRPVQVWANGRTFLRPLLDQGREDLRARLRAAGAVWREDASNETEGFFRNRVRRNVMAAWVQAAGRDAIGGACRSRQLLQEDDEALEGLADAFAPTLRGAGRGLLLGPLKDAPKAVSRRLMQRWLGRCGLQGVLSATAFDALLDGLRQRPSGRTSAGSGCFVAWSKGEVRIERTGKKPGK
jgi:tRNA(Ile)-lysidine synthase